MKKIFILSRELGHRNQISYARKITISGTLVRGETIPIERLTHSERSTALHISRDSNNPPSISDEQRTRLAAVTAMTDEKIDYSDAPYLPDAVWLKATEKLPETER